MPASPDAIHRLFFALWPDDDVRGAMADRARAIDMACAPDGRSTPPGRYHMTLLFLGSFQPLPPTLVENAIAAADTVRAPAFGLVLDRAGSFQTSRVWWLGCTASPALQVLHARLVAAMEAMGAGSPDRSPFVPHVTLGRNPRQPVRAHPIGPLSWPVRDFVLVDSAAGTPAYRIERRWPLDPVNRGSRMPGVR